MALKHLVVNGAICMCNFGVAPDKLKVLTNQKEYANDAEGTTKLIATTMDIGSTFEAGTFGACAKQNGSACKSIVTKWSGEYTKTQLSNGGYPILDDSKATCPIGGADCIRIIFHGQTDDVSPSECAEAEPMVTKSLNPAVPAADILEDKKEVSN
ncbi:MAG TPA: DUF4280 domain-containing protein [Dysgonomonas sp.]|nr:DUF4280 domain-containing protein [Dysgonomonas sp.]